MEEYNPAIGYASATGFAYTASNPPPIRCFSCGKTMLTRYYEEYAKDLKQNMKVVKKELAPKYKQVKQKMVDAVTKSKLFAIIDYLLKISEVLGNIFDNLNIISMLNQPLNPEGSESLVDYINSIYQLIDTIPDEETIGQIPETYVGSVQKVIYSELLEKSIPLSELFNHLSEEYSQWTEGIVSDKPLLQDTKKTLETFKTDLIEIINLMKGYIPDIGKDLYTYQMYNKDMASIRSEGELLLGDLNAKAFDTILGTPKGETHLRRDCCRIIIADAVRRGLAPGVDRAIDESEALKPPS